MKGLHVISITVKMTPALFQVLLILLSGAALVNTSTTPSCSATISSLSGTPMLPVLLVARHGPHIYRRGRRCQVYHNNA